VSQFFGGGGKAIITHSLQRRVRRGKKVGQIAQLLSFAEVHQMLSLTVVLKIQLK